MTEPGPNTCATFEELVQRVLDREAPLTALETTHPTTCAACRGLASAARVLATTPTSSFEAPVELAARITDTVADDYRSRQRWRVAARAGALALAASVLFAGFLYLRPVEQLEVVSAPPRQLPPSPRVADRFADAGSAIATITRKASDQTVAPTRQLLPTTATPFAPMGDVAGVEPVTESLASVPSSAKAGFEPLATTTRRAMNLFMRDTGLSTPPKPKS